MPEKICPIMSRTYTGTYTGTKTEGGIRYSGARMLDEVACLRERCGCWKVETFGPGQSFGSCGLIQESPC